MDLKRSPAALLLLSTTILFFVPITGQQALNPTPISVGSCPKDALELGVCAKLLFGLVNIEAGKLPVAPCCSVLAGLVDLEVATCFCTVIKANILGMNLNIPIVLDVLLGLCGKNLPPDFICS